MLLRSLKLIVLNIAAALFIRWLIVINLTKEMNSNNEADILFMKFWEWRMMDSPEFATFTGVHKYDDKLQSYSIEAFDERQEITKKYLHEAEQLLSEPQIENGTKLNLELFVSELNTYLKGMEVKGYVFPLNYLEGVHIEFERLIEAMNQKTVDDYHKIISRFQALPQQISEIIEVMHLGIKLGMTYNVVSVKGVLEQLDRLQTKPQESVFYKPFTSLPDSIEKLEKSVLQQDALKSISEDVLPSFKKLHNFLKTEYLKHLRPDIGISSLPSGKEFYQLCLDFHLGFHLTPKEVHQMGLKEVARISKEIEKIIEALDLKLSPKNFSERMREDKDFYFTNSEELLEAYNGLVFNKIEPKLHEIIKKIPKSKLVIKPTPESMSSGPAAYYLAGTFDGSRPGVFYVNAADLKASPKYDMMTLALHEAVPGHHLQLSYAMECENLPDFRRYIEDRKYSEAPSRFPLHTAYCEGWGLYSEHLGHELDMYDDIYFHYGHLSFEMFRACRLVVDTGMHSLGWSHDQAVNYMLEHTASHKSHIEGEINRYITWPGQACAYKVGELKIKALREMAENALGPKFDVREFHDVILRNAGPLSLLEEKVTEFIHQYGA